MSESQNGDARPAPAGVQVGPAPTTLGLGQAEAMGKRWLVHQFATAFGVQAYFLDPDVAIRYAEDLAQQARALKSGLHLPPGGVA